MNKEIIEIEKKLLAMQQQIERLTKIVMALLEAKN